MTDEIDTALERLAVKLPAVIHIPTAASTVRDPSALVGFPPMLPVELAARVGTPEQLRVAYQLTQEQWEALKANPVFEAACEEAVKLISTEGGSFRLRARATAELFLQKTFDLVNDGNWQSVPAAVRADLIKFTIRAAGLDASIDQKGAAQGKAISNALQINFHLG